MADPAFAAALITESPAFGLSVSPELVRQFSEHFDLLIAWNRKLNLTRIVDPVEAARFHFLESAMLSTVIPNPGLAGGKVVDVGSGAGFPGLPLACVWPDCEFVLVEPNGKRAVFLKEAVRKLGLSRVSVDTRRFSTEMVGEADTLISRALEGLDRELHGMVRSSARQVVLFSDQYVLEKARELASDRVASTVQVPCSRNRLIGVFTRPS